MLPLRRSVARAPDAGTFPIVVVDAGARGGIVGLDALRSRVILHAFEPDPAAPGASTAPAGLRAFHAVAAALAASDGEATLHVTRAPALSSLLEPDLAAYDAALGHMAGHDGWRRGLDVVERRRVPTITLDAWATRSGIDRVHCLKIDTQGSELDVLRGAAGLLARGGIEVIQVEVALHPFYRGQPRFSEVDAVLSAAGLVPVDYRFSPEAAGPVRRDGRGVRGEAPRWTASADATFVRPLTPTTDRDAAIATALILAQLGYGSTAAVWLRDGAGWSPADVDAGLRRWARPTVAERRRRIVRDLLPPALLDAWRARRPTPVAAS